MAYYSPGIGSTPILTGGPQNRGVFESDYDQKDSRSPGVGSLAYSARDTAKAAFFVPAIAVPSNEKERKWWDDPMNQLVVVLTKMPFCGLARCLFYPNGTR